MRRLAIFVLILPVVFVPLFLYLFRMDFASVILSNGSKIQVEIADDQQKWMTGLSGRDQLEANQGMLFVFPDERVPAFWMKEMRFGIDIVWLSEERIVGVVENAQPENPPVSRYSPIEPVDAVLEVPAGFVRFHAIGVGDRLDISWPDR